MMEWDGRRGYGYGNENEYDYNYEERDDSLRLQRKGAIRMATERTSGDEVYDYRPLNTPRTEALGRVAGGWIDFAS